MDNMKASDLVTELQKHRCECGECQAILRNGHGDADGADFCSIYNVLLYLALNARKEN